MNILIFDTETTGFPVKGKPSTHKDQVRLVELGALLVTLGPTGDYADQHAANLIVNCHEHPIPEQASNVHGITTTRARELGLPLTVVMRIFFALLKRADAVCAYNAEFDIAVLNHAFNQSGYGTDKVQLPWPHRLFDCMPPMTNRCMLPATARQKRYFPEKPYKTPKLAEAYHHVTGNYLLEAHRAINDCRATLEVLTWLVREGIFDLADEEQCDG